MSSYFSCGVSDALAACGTSINISDADWEEAYHPAANGDKEGGFVLPYPPRKPPPPPAAACDKIIDTYLSNERGDLKTPVECADGILAAAADSVAAANGGGGGGVAALSALLRPSARTKKVLYSLSDSDGFDREELPTYEEVSRLFPRSGWFRPLVLVGPPGVGRNEIKRRIIAADPNRYRNTIPRESFIFSLYKSIGTG